MSHFDFLKTQNRTCHLCRSEFFEPRERSCTDIEKAFPICPGCKAKPENRGKPILEILNDKE